MKKSLLVLGVISVVFNVIIIIPYSCDLMSLVNEKLCSTEYWDSTSSDKEVLQSIIDYAMEDHKSTMIMDEHRGLIDDCKKFYLSKSRGTGIINNFFQSYYYAGLSYYAISSKDKKLKKYLQKKAEEFIDVDSLQLSYPIRVVDQYAIGIFFINMYKLTHNELYKKIYSTLYKKLLLLKDEDGLIIYNENSSCHYSDELGMYVPFLMEYFTLTNDSVAINTVNQNIKEFQKYGIDRDTHIPFHGYEKNTKIKLGSTNWGRGIGWYLLALSYCPQETDAILYENIKKLPYTQFPLSNSFFDSSTALMFEIYKQSKRPHQQIDLSFIKPHIRKDGIVDDFSGDTFDFNDYSHLRGCSELGNGFLCILVGKFGNTN